MSNWNRRPYICVVCKREYPDYVGGSRYCSIGCAEEGRAFKPEHCPDHGHELEWDKQAEAWKCPDCKLIEILGKDWSKSDTHEEPQDPLNWARRE